MKKGMKNKGGINMKKLMYTGIIMLIMIFILATNVYAYENSTFKIDLPSDYSEMSYGGLHMFIKNEDTGIIIYTVEAAGLKKNISTMTKSEVKELVEELLEENVTILDQGKEKLGKSKAIKARAMNDEEYIDIYIVVSDKHILLILFRAPSEAELDTTEYLEIKKSFKMKERTTNTTLIRVIILVVIGVGIFLKFKRKYMPA